MDNIRSEEVLVGHLLNNIATIAGDEDNIVQIGAVANILLLLHCSTNTEETAHPIYIQLGVCKCHLCNLNSIELAQLGASLTTLAVTLLD